MMQPTDHISSQVEQWCWSRRSQGGRYHMVITSWVIRAWDAFRASPKSQTLRIPWLEQSRLDVFRSLWMILRSWRQAMAERRSLTSLLICYSLKWMDLSNSLTQCSKYYMTMYTLLRLTEPATLLILIIFGCYRLLRIEIYLREVMGKSSPSFIFSFFIAKILLVGSSQALYTTPYQPS